MAKNYNRFGKIVEGLSVKVQGNNFERAIRQFKRKVAEDGRIQEYRDRCEYIGNSERKRLARKLGKRRAQRQNENNAVQTDRLY